LDEPRVSMTGWPMTGVRWHQSFVWSERSASSKQARSITRWCMGSRACHPSAPRLDA
jgi:hypothetical protein